MPFWKTIGNVGKEILGGLPIVGGLIQSNLNAKVARENTDKTIAANKAMAEYQYSKDLEMWNRGNVYNNPLEQMKRLKAAGLNPNMVYGSGSAAGMAAGQLPKYNAPTLDYNYLPPVQDVPGMIERFQDFRLRGAQIRNTDEQVRGREFANYYADETMWPRVQTQRDQHNLLRIKRDWARDTAAPGGGLQGQLQYQAQYAGGRLRQQELENQKLIAATKNLDLQNDYFAAKAITGLFGGSVGAIGKVAAMIKSGRAGKAAGKLSTGTLKSQPVPAVGKGFSPNTWYQRWGYGKQ